MADPVECIPVAKLQEHCDPFKCPLWPGLDWPIRRSEIAEAVAAGRLNSSRNEEVSLLKGALWTREQHVERIAWFVVHGIDRPIELDVGVPAMGCYVDWFVQDGNHRLAAALYRGDTMIPASVSGQVSYIRELFGEACPTG